MAETIPDLWPEVIEVEVQSPIAIIRRQASQLGVRTKGLLEAKVVTESGDDDMVRYEFRIIAPSLDGYEHALFSAWHDRKLVYPVTVSYDAWVDEDGEGGWQVAASPSELINLLRTILNSSRVKAVLMSLLAKINDPGENKD